MSARLIATAAAGLLVVAGCGDKSVDETPKRRTGADNSQVNARDKNGVNPTPTDQKGDDADMRRTTDIRRRIVDAKLSVDATNVKVIAQSGRVTLRGPVKAQAEKDAIESIAREVAGDGNVDDQIEVESGR